MQERRFRLRRVHYRVHTRITQNDNGLGKNSRNKSSLRGMVTRSLCGLSTSRMGNLLSNTMGSRIYRSRRIHQRKVTRNPQSPRRKASRIRSRRRTASRTLQTLRVSWCAQKRCHAQKKGQGLPTPMDVTALLQQLQGFLTWNSHERLGGCIITERQ